MTSLFEGAPTLASLKPPMKAPWFIGIGAILVVLGVLAFLDTIMTTFASVVVIGFLLIMSGVVHLVQSYSHRAVEGSGFWMTALIGAFYMLAGFLLIREPVAGSIVLTALIAGCLIAVGVMRCIWASGHRHIAHWWAFVLSAVVALVTGVLLYMTMPWSGLWFIGTLVAIELLIGGISAIMFGLSLNRHLSKSPEDARSGAAVPPSVKETLNPPV